MASVGDKSPAELLPLLLRPERTVTNLSDVARFAAAATAAGGAGRPADDIAGEYRRQCELLYAVLARVCLAQLADSRVRFCFYYPHDRAAAAFLRAVQLNTNLFELNLKDNGFDSSTKMRSLGRLLESHGSVAKLNLSRNRFQPGAFATLQRSLSAGTALVALKLSRCGLSDSDGVLLCEVLLRDKHLEFVDISGNSLAGRTAAALAEVLGQNAYLVELNAAWNHFTCADVVAMAAGLARNTELRRLNLSSVGAADAGLSSLLSAAAQPGSGLRVLEASGCRVTHLSTQSLLQFLSQRPPLHALKLNRNLFREKDLLLLLAAVGEESQLALLEMDNVQRSAAIDAATPANLRLTLRLEKEVKVKMISSNSGAE